MHIYNDKKNLKTFFNSKGEIYLSIEDDSNGPEYGEYICLSKEDAIALADELMRIVKEEME